MLFIDLTKDKLDAADVFCPHVLHVWRVQRAATVYRRVQRGATVYRRVQRGATTERAEKLRPYWPYSSPLRVVWRVTMAATIW
jgi:hypothetical protein